jgi:hypothetical protein
MKSTRDAGIPLIAVFCVAFGLSERSFDAFAQDTHSAAAGVKRIRLETKIEYTNARGPTQIQILDDVPKMLREAGFVVATPPTAADAVLTIRLQGTALRGNYGRVLYAGAKWDCTITLIGGSFTLYERSFSCVESPPDLLRNYSPEKPEDAPFDPSIANCTTFWWTIVEMVQTLWGSGRAVKAALKVPLNSGDHLARIGETAVPIMLTWLGTRDDRCLTALQFFENVKDKRSVVPMLEV